jgi:hypothetical protein
LRVVDITVLYHGPLDDFVARRTALVRALRSTDADGARAAAALRKPSVSAWAIDQLAVADPGVVAELLAAGADAREAQHEASGGAGSADDVVRTAGRLRDGVEAAARAAAAVLEDAGHAGGEETARRIRTTLRAAATGDADERLGLWRGTLDRDLEATGFGSLSAPDDDPPELAEVLVPLRRPALPQHGRSPQVRARPQGDSLARHSAERALAGQEKAAQRAREIAGTKRRLADRLAEEARAAGEDAAAAEHVAETAEAAARTARESLDR